MTTTREKQTATDPLPVHRGWARRTFKWLGIGLAVLVVGVTAWWVLTATGKVPPPAPITVAAPTQPAPTFDSNADGCLGGPLNGDPAATVLTAHDMSTLDEQGAAGYALAFIRYGITSTGDLKLASTLPQLVTPGWLPEATTYLSQTNTQLVSEGGGTSSVPGAPDTYRVVAADPSAASMTVTVVMFWSRPATGQQAQFIVSVILDAAAGHWLVAGFAPQPADALAPIVGIPWTSYAGPC